MRILIEIPLSNPAFSVILPSVNPAILARDANGQQTSPTPSCSRAIVSTCLSCRALMAKKAFIDGAP